MTRELFFISTTQTGTAYITPLTTSIYHPTSRAISILIGSNGKTSSLVPRLIIYIPLKTFKRRSSPPWIDGEVRRLLSKKDSCRKKAKLSSSANLWEKFRDLRRAAKTLVRTKRREYFQKLPSLLKSNSKKFWSIFKSTSKHSNIPSKMSWTQQDSTFSTAENPVDIVNLLNRYFYSVFKHSDTTDDHFSSVAPVS